MINFTNIEKMVKDTEKRYAKAKKISNSMKIGMSEEEMNLCLTMTTKASQELTILMHLKKALQEINEKSGEEWYHERDYTEEQIKAFRK